MGKGCRIVIAGANFAGLKAALALPRHYDVTVIDPNPSFEFLPNIHELVSRYKVPRALTFSKARRLAMAGHRLAVETVRIIDPAGKRVLCESGEIFPYDIAVVAVGGENDTFGVPGADRFALPFKSVAGVDAIGTRLKQLAREEPGAPVLVVGGGLEGIEALGEILRRYRNRPRIGFDLHLVERGERLLPEMPEAMDRELKEMCGRYGVTLHTGEAVTGVEPDGVVLAGGARLESRLTVWTGGARAKDLLAESGLSPGRGRWAPVRDTLQSLDFDDLFIVGDSAELPEPVAKQAYYALEMGAAAARNIRRMVRGRRIRPFRPSPRPELLAFGDLSTYMIMGEWIIAAPLLAGLKESVYQYTMTNFDPPDNITSLLQLSARTGRGVFNLAFPALSDLSALRRLPGVRLLR